MTTTTAEHLDVSAVILALGRWKCAIEQKAADPTFLAWRHEDEPGSLRYVVMAARSRAEDLRFLPEPERAQRLQLLWNSLPVARLRQLLDDEPHEPEAA